MASDEEKTKEEDIAIDYALETDTGSAFDAFAEAEEAETVEVSNVEMDIS
jgi:hypothetical protein